MSFEFLELKVEKKIATISLNRADKANALNMELWKEIEEAFTFVKNTSDVRVAILRAHGPIFCAGIDLTSIMQLPGMLTASDESRKREQLREIILKFQAAFNAIEECKKPVLTGIQGKCIGAGLDMISACDIRFATQNASFVLKEIDMGITADVGTLQRLPHLIPDGLVREMAYTGAPIDAKRALASGLINAIYETQEEMDAKIHEMAALMASKSPLAMRGTKEMILYTRDNPVRAGLEHVALYNASMLLSEDVMKSVMAFTQKTTPEYED